MNLRRLALVAALALSPAAFAQTYIVSYAPVEFPVNTPGATFTLSGIFPYPNFSANSTQYGVCFYTGFGASPTPIVPTNETSLGNSNYSATLTVPASSFQVTSGFDASGFNRSGSFYIAPANSTCNGVVNTSLSSRSPLLIALPPSVTSFAASEVQQPNPNLSTIPPPRTLTFAGNYFYGLSNGGPASVVFNWSSSTTSTATVTASAVPSQTSLVAALPQLPTDVSNLTAQVCNPVGTYTSCSASISIPVNALVPSTGTVNSSASPATLGTSVNLTATFSSVSTGPGSSNPVPAGTVTFTSDNTGSVVTIGTAPLVLDPNTSQWVSGSQSPLTLMGGYPSLPTVTTDLNHDGLADVVLYADAYTNSPATPAQFTILLGTMPYGSFQAPQTLALPANCASVTSYALGDLNSDGFPDLVLACVPLSPTTNDPYETYLFFGNGDGTFSVNANITTATGQVVSVTGSLVALADVNKDGKLDLISQGPIYGQNNSYGFVVLQGDGYGDLYLPNTNSSYPGSTTSTGSFLPGSQFLMVDLNNDGYPDLAELHVNGPHGNTIDIYLNHGGTYFGGGPLNGGIQPDTYVTLGAYPSNYISLFAGDLNQDGRMDLGAAQTAATSNSNPYSIDYVLSTGSGTTPTFGAYQSLGLSNAPSYVAAADFTGDGYPDLLVGSSNTHVYGNDQTGHFADNTDLYLSAYPTPRVLAVTDLNGDSVADLIQGSTTYSVNGQAFAVSGEITSGSATATLPYTFTTGTNANITATWPGSASIAAPTTAPTLSLPLTGTSSGGGSGTPTYSITNTSPSSISVGSGDTSIIIVGNPLPTFSSGTYGVCFYTGYGASSTVIIPTNGDGRATFTAPASSIQQVPASAFSGGTYNAQIYVIAAGGTCNGTPDPSLSNVYGLPIVGNTATIYNLQVPFVPALNPNLGGEGGPPPYPSLLLGTGDGFTGTGQTPTYSYEGQGSNSPLTQLYESIDGSGSYQSYYGSNIFNSGSFAAAPVTYPSPSTSVGIQACDNLGSPCSNTVTLPVHPLETDNATASYQVLNANTETIRIPSSSVYQAANAGFYYDTSAATSSSLTNVSPYAPTVTGQYSVSATGLYTFYSGDIGSTVTLTYDTTTTSTSPTVNNPIAVKATFGTATPDVTGAPSGYVSFYDTDTGTSYNGGTLTLDPTATWVPSTGGFYSGIDKIALRPTIQDFNNDLLPDMLVVDDGNVSGAPSLELLTGTLPSGTYTSGAYFYVQNVLPNCNTIVSYAVADFNNDGYADVAILCTPFSGSTNTLSVLLNNGDGTFSTSPITWGGSISGSQIVTGDFNSDGNQDIVYAGIVNSFNGNNTIGFQVLNGDGTGNFLRPDFYTSAPLAVGTQLVAADFDQDGYTDLAVLNGDPNNPNIAVYQNVGSVAGNIGVQFNTTPTTIAIPSAASVNNITIAALGYNQLPSIVFPVTGTATPGLYAARNTGTNGSSSAPGTITFATTVVTPVANLTNAVFGDINGDGNLDAAFDNATNISVLTGDGSGAFNGTAFTALTLSDTGNTLLALADQNYDGYADLFTYTPPQLQSAVRSSGPAARIARSTLQAHDVVNTNNLNTYISAGTASATTQPATFATGQHDFQINTPGTVQIANGSATTSFNVLQNSYTDSLAVTTSGSPSTFGQAVQIYATIITSGGIPTGNVTFYDGSNQIGTAALNQSTGVASIPYSGFSAGQHNLTAQYTTDGTYPSATSPIFTQVVNQATPTIKWAPPTAITYGTALSATQLNATATDINGNPLAGSFNYSPALGTILGAGTKPLSVTFTPSDVTDYSSPTVGNSIVVNKFTPSLTWTPTVTTLPYNTPLSAAQLDPVAKDANGNILSGAFTYVYARSAPTVASGPAAIGTVLSPGSYSITGTFTPSDTTDFNSGTPITYIGFTVTQGVPVVTWPTPAAITYGTALSATQLNAVAKDVNGNVLAGTYMYTPALGAVLGAGTQSLSVTFTPTDTTYSATTVGNSILVNKATPTILWPTPAAITYGTALSATQLNASTPVQGSFNYTPGLGTVLGAGTKSLSVTFTPTDTTDYSPATVGNSILVNKATPVITWAPPAAITYGTPLSATQLNATTPVPGVFTYNPNLGTVLNAGTQTLSVGFVPTDTTDYNTVPVTTTSILVNKATPTITWAPPAAITYGTPLSATQLNATTPVPGVFTYNPTLGTVLGAGTQTLSVGFVPTDTTDYNAVPVTTTSILVNKATPTITWAPPAAITYGTPLSATQLNATTPVPGVFTYNPTLGTVLNAGTQTLSVGFVPTDTTDYNTVPVTTTTLLVNKANPILNYTPTPLAITYGTALSASQLGATSSDPTGTFAYTYTGTASGTTLPGTVLGAGSYVLKATFTPTDTNYNAASINGGTLVVSQATPVLTWANPADIIGGVPLSATQLNATVGGAIPGVFTYTPASGTVLSAGNGQTLSVKFTPTDLVDYTTATKTAVINVIPLVLTTVSPAAATLGDPAKLITLTGTGFLANSVVQANGTALPTNYVNATTLTATIPASSFLTLSPIAITVLDPTQALSTNALAMTIAAAVPAVTFTGPATMPPGEQPSLTYTLNNPYPVPLTDTITLSFAGTGGVDDPAIQFATGGRTLTFVIPAGSSVVPNLQFQDGTDAGTITATLTMTALNTNVTPPNATPVQIVIPPAPPFVASATLTRSGNVLTVFIVGYSNTREMASAAFHFNAAPGATINDPDLTVQAPALFTPWFSQAASQAYGSNFGYTQTFNLSTDASSVGSVTVTLTNTVGNSITVTAQ